MKFSDVKGSDFEYEYEFKGRKIYKTFPFSGYGVTKKDIHRIDRFEDALRKSQISFKRTRVDF